MLARLVGGSRYLIIIAVALVIAGLTYFLSQKTKKDKPANEDRPEQLP